VVRDGQSDINESMITGESRPVEKVIGAKVIAGTINGAGALRIEVTATGDKTALAGIMRLVADAQRSRSRAQILADRAAFWLTWVALVCATATLVVWLAVGASGSEAIERFVTVLVIACPHALGLAVPLVVAISTTMGAQNGLLVRDRRGLEEARNLTTVVFDKTGTLTLGQHRVVDIAAVAGVSPEEALAIGAALERNSEHPVAKAIVSTAEERGVARYEASDFSYTAGRGVEATVNGQVVAGGGPNLLSHLKLQPAPEIVAMADRAAVSGQGTIYLVRNATEVIAGFAVADAIRPESRAAVEQLHAAGMEVAMLTGDAQAVADGVAKELGIDTVFAQVLPEQKSEKIRELQAQGKRVAMIGDGVNDAPALTQSDVAIAIGAGTDVAVEAGDIILVRSDPRDIARIITLSRATYRKMVQNLWWAAGYNVVAIPLAAGVFSRWGLNLTPAGAAVLMSASTIIVAVNAQLLRRTRL
jgi:Cu2+-exporting ATPase